MSLTENNEKIKTSQNTHAKKIAKKHMTVRIPKGITEAIEDFLTTEQAAKMGFDSKADVVTTAVRRLLTEYGYYNIPPKTEKIKQSIIKNDE